MTAYLAPQFDTQFFDGQTVAAGYKLYTYDTGTTTPKAVYTDQAGTVPHTNPIILDAAGRVSGQLWLGSGEYTFVLKTAADATVKTWNDVGVGDVQALRADLASTSEASQNAGLIALNLTLNYAAGTIGARLAEKIKINDFPFLAPKDGISDATAAVAAAFNLANSKGLYIDADPGTYKITSTLPTLTSSPGIKIESGDEGHVIFHHYATTDCIVSKGSYKTFKGFTLINKSAAGAGTAGHALLHMLNSAYSKVKDVYTAHDLDNYSGVFLEQVYDGSAADGAFLQHLGCWYNTFDNVAALYATFGGTRGYGVRAGVNANAIGITNPAGADPGTYTGSIVGNEFNNLDIEARVEGLKLHKAAANRISGGQFLGGTNQITFADSQQNLCIGVKHNQWTGSPTVSTGTSGQNVHLYPVLFNVTPQPWNMGTLGAGDVVIHSGGGMNQAIRLPGPLDLPLGQIAFPAPQNASADPNTLDDYEESQWVPDLKFGGAAVGLTYASRGGNYTKVGNLVTATFQIRLSAKGSSTGQATVENLPFVSKGSGGDGYAVAVIHYYSGFTGVGKCGTGYSSGAAVINELADNSGPLDASRFTNSSILFGSITYMTP